MASAEISRVGEGGTIVIPPALRERFGIAEGSYVVIQESEEGLLIHNADPWPVEIYTAERKAEFLLNNAVSKADYDHAMAEVRSMGLNPDEIPHLKPWED